MAVIMKTVSKQQSYSLYSRIKKKGCCNKWLKNSGLFYTWYENQTKKQEHSCRYCQLPGDTECYYGKHFRVGRRGLCLEVDRKDNNKLYSPRNCVLACYPCNNAKSDVFSYKEFLEIGKAIRKAKIDNL